MVILPLHYVPSLAQDGVFSERNVRRWCAEQGLVMDFCPDSQLEVEVANGIAEVGFKHSQQMNSRLYSS